MLEYKYELLGHLFARFCIVLAVSFGVCLIDIGVAYCFNISNGLPALIAFAVLGLLMFYAAYLVSFYLVETQKYEKSLRNGKD